MRRSQTRKYSRKFLREAGATMVEAAIFGSVLVALLMGAVVGGIYFGDSVSIQWGSRSGARAGAVGGSDGFADYDILKAVREATYFFPDDAISIVVVYHAGGFGEEPSSTCAAGTPVAGKGIGDCNIYRASDFKRPSSDFGSVGWTGDDYYLPSNRSVNGYTGTDYLGVYVKADCSCGTNVFGGSGTIKSSTVMRLEAREV